MSNPVELKDQRDPLRRDKIILVFIFGIVIGTVFSSLIMDLGFQLQKEHPHSVGVAFGITCLIALGAAWNAGRDKVHPYLRLYPIIAGVTMVAISGTAYITFLLGSAVNPFERLFP